MCPSLGGTEDAYFIRFRLQSPNMSTRSGQTAPLNEAKALFQNGQFEQCKQCLLHALQMKPKDPLILAKLGEVCWRLHDTTRAATFYQMAIKIDDGSNSKSLFNFGKILSELNRLDEAQDAFRKSIKIVERACVYYHLGLVCVRKSDEEYAINSFKAATKIQPTVVEYRFQLAKALYGANRLDEAAASYEKALELTHHGDGSVLFEYSQFLYQTGLDRSLAMELAKLVRALLLINDLLSPFTDLSV